MVSPYLFRLKVKINRLLESLNIFLLVIPFLVTSPYFTLFNTLFVGDSYLAFLNALFISNPYFTLFNPGFIKIAIVCCAANAYKKGTSEKAKEKFPSVHRFEGLGIGFHSHYQK